MRKLSVFVAFITLTLGFITPARAATPGVMSQAQASAACEAFFGVTAGPEPLSACQWDMRTIEAGAASYANATGDGVTVGVIDGGVDMTHPDLVANLDVARSCSFIFSNTPTADPQEVANGNCSNKAAIQDLQVTAPMSRRRSPGPSTMSGSPAWRPMPRSSRSRPARSSGSASSIRWPRRCGTPATSAWTW